MEEQRTFKTSLAAAAVPLPVLSKNNFCCHGVLSDITKACRGPDAPRPARIVLCRICGDCLGQPRFVDAAFLRDVSKNAAQCGGL
jgi:hypothetical protein